MNTSNTSNTWRWIGLIILLLILLILWLMGYGPSFSGNTPGCCGVPLAQTAPATPPPAVAPVAQTQALVNLGLKNNDGKITLTGEVPSETERQNLVNSASQTFGAGNVIDQLIVKNGAALPGWWNKLAAVFTWLKSGKQFGLSQLDKLIILSGAVDNEPTFLAKEREIKMLIGDADKVNNLIRVDTPAVAQPAAAPAVPECSADMNVAIQFETNSAKLSAGGKQQLDEVVKCLKSPTEVAGHTDDVGGDAYNIKLSKARANSVLSYIKSSNPAKAKLLKATGYGEAQPIADNGTEAGRAQNRRIEFKAK